jgi:hypothetical protein
VLEARLNEPSHLRRGTAVCYAPSTDGSASRTAAITAQQGITDRQTPIPIGKIWGQLTAIDGSVICPAAVRLLRIG